MASNEEGYVIDNSQFHSDGIFSFGEAFFDAGIRDNRGLFVHRRDALVRCSNLYSIMVFNPIELDPQPFGRSINANTTPEATTHPLLLDMSSANQLYGGLLYSTLDREHLALTAEFLGADA